MKMKQEARKPGNGIRGELEGRKAGREFWLALGPGQLEKRALPSVSQIFQAVFPPSCLPDLFLPSWLPA
jgi:hypothetical protein